MRPFRHQSFKARTLVLPKGQSKIWNSRILNHDGSGAQGLLPARQPQMSAPDGERMCTRSKPAPGGESAYWPANLASPSREMPVESFYDWPLKPYLRAVPGTEISALLSRPATRSPEYDDCSSGVVSCASLTGHDNKSNSPSHSRRVESIYELHVPRVVLPCCLDRRLWVSPTDSFRADETMTDRRYAE